jgi:hypothetical protein
MVRSNSISVTVSSPPPPPPPPPGVASITLAVSPTTCAAPCTVIFSGRYVDANGNPVAGRALYLYHGTDSVTRGNVVTDATGSYSIALAFTVSLAWSDLFYKDLSTGLVSNSVPSLIIT